MFDFLHTFHPSPILAEFGPFIIRWYGLLFAVGSIVGILVIRSLALRYQLREETILGLSFTVLVSGFLGARLYHVLNELPYYWQHPLEVVMVWQGGLAFHGGVLAGVAAIIVYCRRHGLRPLWATDLFVPGLLIGQAIGRWGNYFNQELFGRPTTLPWGIPIDPLNRPAGMTDATFFHPTFLYESLWNVILFALFFFWHRRLQHPNGGGKRAGIITFTYLTLSSVGRFATELLRVDRTPVIVGVRLPLLISAGIVLASLIALWMLARKPISSPSMTQ